MKTIKQLTDELANALKSHSDEIVAILKVMPSGTGIPLVVTVAEMVAKEIEGKTFGL